MHGVVNELELAEIQGLLIRGYADHPVSASLMLSVSSAEAARAWLALRLDAIYTAGHRVRAKQMHAEAEQRLAHSMPPLRAASDRPTAVKAETSVEPEVHGLRLNLAITHRGLAALGYPEADLKRFPGAFQLGITQPAHRNRVLGDTGRSAPDQWHFDDLGHDLLLLCFAHGEAELDAGLSALTEELTAGFAIVKSIKTYLPPHGREHFGFRDGISQPYMRGTDLSGVPAAALAPGSLIAAGEFVLGYENEFFHLPHSPTVPAETDSGNALPQAPRFAEDDRSLAVPEGGDLRDFGRNGTFLVLRQLEQHVDAFHAYCLAQANGDTVEAQRLEAKLVGRWHDGSPLALCPASPDPKQSTENRFSYAEDDLAGVHCPVGAHVRRGFPRDAKVDLQSGVNAERALQLTRQHRMIRRGRLYQDNETGERGLMFVCLNSNIERQFEFVQQTWCNSEKFAGLYDERDPIVGNPPEHQDDAGAWQGDGRFTIPGPILRKRLTGIPRFVTVRGGGYYFLPSIRALRYLSKL